VSTRSASRGKSSTRCYFQRKEGGGLCVARDVEGKIIAARDTSRDILAGGRMEKRCGMTDGDIPSEGETGLKRGSRPVGEGWYE